jgi:hypothetical protein
LLHCGYLLGSLLFLTHLFSPCAGSVELILLAVIMLTLLTLLPADVGLPPTPALLLVLLLLLLLGVRDLQYVLQRAQLVEQPIIQPS